MFEVYESRFLENARAWPLHSPCCSKRYRAHSWLSPILIFVQNHYKRPHDGPTASTCAFRVERGVLVSVLLPVMAVHSLRCGNAAVRLFLASLTYIQYALAITGSVYQLDSEYLGANFFQGWDFYTVCSSSTRGISGGY